MTALPARTWPLRTTALAALLVLLAGLGWAAEASAATPERGPEASVWWTAEGGPRTVGRLGVALTRGLPPAVRAPDARSRTAGMEGGDTPRPSDAAGARPGGRGRGLSAGPHESIRRAASGLERCRLSGVFRL